MGVGLGAGLGLLAWLLISHSYFNNTREFFVNIIGPWKLNWTEVLMVSCCAGIGEEILFRGGIQPLLGIGWTSLLFVMLHGYITPFNRTLTIYGLFMVFAIMVIGWAAVKFGLIVAIVAHTMIDVILLNRLTRAYDPSLEDTSQE
jgi:membrane protease YdiL (CAAX protease family)